MLRQLDQGPWPAKIVVPRLGLSGLRQRLRDGFPEDMTLRDRLRSWTLARCKEEGVVGKYIYMSKDKKVWNGQNNLLEVQGSKTVVIKVAFAWKYPWRVS
jgi:hypothetical protein